MCAGAIKGKGNKGKRRREERGAEGEGKRMERKEEQGIQEMGKTGQWWHCYQVPETHVWLTNLPNLS